MRINIPRDTGASQSVIRQSQLPARTRTATGRTVMIRAIEDKPIKVPLHKIYLESKWGSGNYTIGIVDTLPMKGVSMLLGNDLAGDRINSAYPKQSKPKPRIGGIDGKAREVGKSAVAITRGRNKKANEGGDKSNYDTTSVRG